MGLLGEGWDDPRSMATMQLAAGLLGGGNFGQALGRGLSGYQQVLGQAQEDAYRKEVMDWQRQKIQEARDQTAAQKAWIQKMNPQTMAVQNALSGGGGPTQANASKLQPVDPTRQMLWEAANAGVVPAGDYIKSMMPDNEAYTLGEGQVRYKGNQVVAKGPEKAPDLPSAVREYQFAQQQGYKGNFVQFQLDQKRAGATNVAVNTADPTALARAGMDFQDKYRNATKDSFVRAAAYNAMLEASKNPSAKGDISMVYSFVKALDPTSAVREGEIDLVNANRSVPDRVKGYAQKLANGQSLLPNERADILQQARNLTFTDYKRSRNDIQAYRDNASRLTLDPKLYAPDPYESMDFSPRNLDAAGGKRSTISSGGWSASEIR